MPNDIKIHPSLEHEEGLTFKFIRDLPAEADSFGSHDRLATALSEVVAQNVDLKVIGLLGPWGAGKSTVVRLVQKRLKEARGVSTHCFSYDAWLHQSDPPRRAFLETLIYFLVQEGLTSLEKWQPQLDQLNRQVEESETTSTPTLTSWGKRIAFSLLLWPIGFAFAGHDWYAAALAPKAHFSNIWPVFMGLFFIVLPLIVLASVYLSWRPIKYPFSRNYFTRKNFNKHRAPHQDDSILSLFINKEVQRQRNRVTRTPDPTTIEFQNIFREIMDAVKAKERRFLFVIDNLDRLPEAEAVAMWGTIRSFFLGALETRHVRKAAADMPTVILPIDEEAIRRMYSASHSIEDVDGLAQSFIDKTFDLTFRVTRPVLSDWNSYLLSQMKQVFGPTMPPLWPYIAGRLYERYFIGQTDPNVTPRTINSMINAIATLWLQWRNSGVTFPTVAYYCIFRRGIDENILFAVTTPAPVIANYDPDWQSGIAALHYGTAPAEAAQILIEQPLRSAILAKDRTNLESLKIIPGFDRVLLRIFDHFAIDGVDAAAVLGAATMLQHLDADEDLWCIEGWHRLLNALSMSSQWRVFGSDEAEGIAALAEHCQTSELPLFLGTLSSKLSTIKLDIINISIFANSFVKAWNAALLAAQGKQHKLPLVPVPGDSNLFLAIVSACGENKLVLTQLVTDIDDISLISDAAIALLDPVGAITAEAKFNALYSLARPFVWDPLILNASKLVAGQHASTVGIASALLILGRLRTTQKTAQDVLQALTTNGTLVARLTEAYAQDLDIVTARSLALLLICEIRTFTVPGNGNWIQTFSQRPHLVDLICQSFVEFGEPDYFELLIDAAVNHPPLKIIARTIASFLIRKATLGSLHLEPILTNLHNYFECIDDNLQETFVAQVATYQTFWDVLQKQPFEGVALEILQILIKQPGEVGEKARSSLSHSLNSVEVQTWVASVRTAGKLLEVLASLAKVATRPVTIGSHLYDALQFLVDEVLQTATADSRNNWFNTASYLNSDAYETLLRNLRDAILGAQTVTLLADLLTIGGSKLIDLGGFNEKADDCTRRIVLQLLLDDASIEWLEKNSAVTGVWIKGAKNSTKKVLKDRFEELSMVEGASRKDGLRVLSEMWFPAGKSA